MKKGLSILLAMVMMMSIFMVIPVSVSAGAVNTSETGASKTADEAIAWCYSKLGQSIETFDSRTSPLNYMYQCVDFVAAYYQYLGVSYQTQGGGGYSTATPPSGWQRIQGAKPQKGDILVYVNGDWGHVGIYESDYSTFHQNFNGHYYVERVTNLRYDNIGVPYWGVVRPNFTGLAAPSYAYISTDKQNYAVDEIVHFYFNTDITDKKNTLWVYCPDGSTLYYQHQGTCMDLAFGMQGHFEGLVEAWNDNGSCKSQRISWHVGEPQFAYLSTDKQNYAVDENVHFTFDTDILEKKNTLWVYCPDGSTLYYQHLGADFTLAFGMQGHFEGLVQAWNDYGNCISERISWHVGAPQYAYIITDKKNYAIDENVHFTFDTDITDNKNTLWVYCPDGSTLYYQHLNTDFTLAFGMQGHFEGLVQAWNEYGNCISERISWNVGIPLLLGDVDGDESVTIIDATCIQRKLASIPTATFIETVADADGDGELTIIDATVIQRHLAQLPAPEGIGKPIA